MALSNAERQRRFKQRRREAEEDALRRQWKREDEAASAATKASTKVTAAQEAIRKGVDPTDAYSKFRDREGNLHDLRDILLMDTWDTALEDERQRAAEADGTWPQAEKADAVA